MPSSIQCLRELIDHPAIVSRRRRAAAVGACIAPSVSFAAFVCLICIAFGFLAFQSARRYPDAYPLHQYLMVLDDLKSHVSVSAIGEKYVNWSVEATPENIDFVETYIARRFHDTIDDPGAMTSWPWFVDEAYRARAKEVAAAHPSVSDADFEAAKKVVDSASLPKIFEGKAAQEALADFKSFLFYVPILFVVLASCTLAPIAIFCLAAAVLCRGGLVLWGLGLAVVRADGAPASRLQILWRALVAWAPLLVCVVVNFFYWGRSFPVSIPAGQLERAAIGSGIVLITYVVLAILSILLPGRGIPDRLAGTWLVRR